MVASQTEISICAGGTISGAGLAEVVGIAPLAVGAHSLCTGAKDESSDDEDELQSGFHES